MKVEIYSRNLCGYCSAAKKLLDQHSISYTEYMIDEDSSHKQKLFEQVPNARTVPQVIIDDETIGGFTELREWIINYPE